MLALESLSWCWPKVPLEAAADLSGGPWVIGSSPNCHTSEKDAIELGRGQSMVGTPCPPGKLIQFQERAHQILATKLGRSGLKVKVYDSMSIHSAYFIQKASLTQNPGLPTWLTWTLDLMWDSCPFWHIHWICPFLKGKTFKDRGNKTPVWVWLCQCKFLLTVPFVSSVLSAAIAWTFKNLMLGIALDEVWFEGFCSPCMGGISNSCFKWY